MSKIFAVMLIFVFTFTTDMDGIAAPVVDPPESADIFIPLIIKFDCGSQDPDCDSMPIPEELFYGTDPYTQNDWSYFEFVSGVLNTPQRNSRYMKDYLKYIPDPPSNPNYLADETFDRGGGDCEDLAAFAVHNMRKAGIESSGLDVQWGNLDGVTAYGHAVGMYFDGVSYWYIGTGSGPDLGRIFGPFQTINQVADHVNSSWIRWTRFSETFEHEERVYK